MLQACFMLVSLGDSLQALFIVCDHMKYIKD